MDMRREPQRSMPIKSAYM